MVTHSSILAWEIAWTEEPGRLQSMGLQKTKLPCGCKRPTHQSSMTKPAPQCIYETKEVLDVSLLNSYNPKSSKKRKKCINNNNNKQKPQVNRMEDQDGELTCPAKSPISTGKERCLSWQGLSQ